MAQWEPDCALALLKDGRVLAVGSTINYYDTGGLGDASIFDPASGQWTPTGSPLEAMYLPTATSLDDGRVVVAGSGYVEVYDPSSGKFSKAGTLLDKRYLAAATPLLDGRILLTGGWDLPDPKGVLRELKTAQIYDPKTGQTTWTGSMSTVRDRGQAVRLEDGRVLMMGGNANLAEDPLASAEIFDPSTGTFTLTGSMAEPRADFSAALLPDGRVLVAGGGPIPVSGEIGGVHVEIYDPVTGKFKAAGTAAIDPRLRLVTMPLPDGRVVMVDLDGTAGIFDLSSDYQPFTSLDPIGTYEGGEWSGTAILLRDGRLLFPGSPSSWIL
jgi:hypothetical protein